MQVERSLSWALVVDSIGARFSSVDGENSRAGELFWSLNDRWSVRLSVGLTWGPVAPLRQVEWTPKDWWRRADLEVLFQEAHLVFEINQGEATPLFSQTERHRVNRSGSIAEPSFTLIAFLW